MKLIIQTKFSNPSSAVSLDVSRGTVSCSRPSRTQLSMECMQEDHFGHAGASHLFLYSHQSRSFLCNCSSTHRATDISRDCRPWAIDNINHVQCGSAACIMLDGEPRFSLRLRAACIPGGGGSVAGRPEASTTPPSRHLGPAMLFCSQ